MVTHDTDVAAYGDRIVEMVDGRILNGNSFREEKNK
jgi:ABC-type lipoprotein export system ATPase subunit